MYGFYMMRGAIFCKQKTRPITEVQNQPVHLEVGMGKGRFLMDMAKLHPEINYIGIEMYDSVLLRAIQKKEALAEEGQELSNLKFMRMDARLLPEVFEKGEVEKIYLNFSAFSILPRFPSVYQQKESR